MPHNYDFLNTPCNTLKGVGTKVNTLLAKLGIYTLFDLLLHLPLRYENRTKITPIAQGLLGEPLLIDVKVLEATYPIGGKTKLLCTVTDLSSKLQLRFFHLSKQHHNKLVPGARLLCFGELRTGNHGLEMTHPQWQVLSAWQSVPLLPHLTAIYPTVATLHQTVLRNLIAQTFSLWVNDDHLPQLLPDTYLHQHQLLPLQQALLLLHYPPPDTAIEQILDRTHPATHSLIIEELVAYRLKLLAARQRYHHYHALACVADPQLEQILSASLPYSVTSAQRRVLDDIYLNLASTKPMLRLLQGDVGSGKTLVAMFAAVRVASNGYQVVLLAPTELLAEQHYRVFKHYLEPLQLNIALLVGKLSTSAKNDCKTAISAGTIQIIIATHAILQADVAFKHLGLVIIDEQQRFGVIQQTTLANKSGDPALVPHQLIMTATPIPRTLAMSIYADLDSSIIDELPAGRTIVTTTLTPHKRRHEVIDRVGQACHDGRQVYWVCPLIDEHDTVVCQAVTVTAAALRAQLPPSIKIGLLHGQMPMPDKTQVMTQFAAGAIDLLVATTIIEVGVDVPRASIMVIDNAERLGLAQLHQLRGRVGRGSTASYCVLLYQTPLSAIAQQRLSIMRTEHDGFAIAEQDLTLRGPGDLCGLRQAGDLALRIAVLQRDHHLLQLVNTIAASILHEHAEIATPLINRWHGSIDS